MSRKEMYENLGEHGQRITSSPKPTRIIHRDSQNTIQVGRKLLVGRSYMEHH